jgi:UDP-glucose 4-epimerase
MIAAGLQPVILDNCCNSSVIVLDRIESITGSRPDFYHGDIRHETALAEIFAPGDIEAVIHFAGLKAVGESVSRPLEYYDNNVNGTLVLARAMAAAGVTRLIFSSSATVYGEPAEMPIRESAPVGGVTNPYGRSKLMVEECLRDLQLSDPRWSITLLRYFNPVGAHRSGLIGEDPRGTPNNLLPFVAQVAVGRRERLAVFGDDYATVDGTGVRDYIHVVDLARGHLAALAGEASRPGVHVYNLGTGVGTSVLQMVAAFREASGRPIPYEICPRREGDVAQCWADPGRAMAELDWRPLLSLQDMVADAWRWQRQNPGGYEG